MWWTKASCLKANFITVTVNCIIAYIVWLFLYPCGLQPCNGLVESEINLNWNYPRTEFSMLHNEEY